MEVNLNGKQDFINDNGLSISKTMGLQDALNSKQATITDSSLSIARTIGLQDALNGKQATLIEGNNIIITNNTISSTGGAMQDDLESLQSNVTTMQGDLEALETTILNEITRATNAELLIIDSILTSTRTYISGEIIKTHIIYKSSFSTFNNNISIKNSWQLHSKCSYIANGSNILYVTYNLSEYNYAGTGDDALYARMQITYNGSTTYSYRTRQNYIAGTGGGTRSGTIIPLSFNYNITGTAKNPAVTIGIDVYLGGDDNWTCDTDNNGAHFHILEYMS